MPDATLKLEIEIPRSHAITVRKLNGNMPVKESVEAAIATFTNGWQAGVEISKSAIDEISSLLNVKSFNSEAALIEAIKARFNLSARHAVVEMDESLTTLIRRKALGNSLPFSEYVNRFVHSMFRFGILDWAMKTVFFDEGQWDRVKKALGKVPSTGENFAKVMEEWAHMKATQGAVALPPAQPSTQGQKPKELSASDRNIQKAEAEDAARTLAQKNAAVGLDPHSPEYRQKLAAAMDKMAPKPPVPQPAPALVPEPVATGEEVEKAPEEPKAIPTF